MINPGQQGRRDFDSAELKRHALAGALALVCLAFGYQSVTRLTSIDCNSPGEGPLQMESLLRYQASAFVECVSGALPICPVTLPDLVVNAQRISAAHLDAWAVCLQGPTYTDADDWPIL